MKRNAIITIGIILLALSAASAQDRSRRTKPRGRGRATATGVSAKTAPVKRSPRSAAGAKSLPAQAKNRIDPDRIPVTSPKTFKVTDPQLGTRPYAVDIGLTELERGGFALVYEAVVDESKGGKVQGLLAFLTPTLQQRGAVLPITTRHKSSVLLSIELREFADERLLLVYRERSEPKPNLYSVNYMIFSKKGSVVWGPKKLSGNKRNQQLLGFTLVPGGVAAMVFFQHGDTTFASVIGSTGKLLVRPRALVNAPVPGAKDGKVPIPEIRTAPRLLDDGRLMLAARCNRAAGMIYLDAYGQWVGDFRRFKLNQSKKLYRDVSDILPLPGSERYLLLLPDRPRQLLVMNEPRVNFAVHQLGIEHPVYGEGLQTFAWDDQSALVLYRQRKKNGRYAVHALVMSNLGTISKPDQVVFPDVHAPVTAVHLRSGDLLLVGMAEKPKGFLYALVRNPVLHQ